MIELDRALHEKFRSLGAVAYKKFLCAQVQKNWSRLVDEKISAHVEPVKIERGILFVGAESSAFRDQLKFFKEEILDAINGNFAQDEPLVKEIKIVKIFKAPAVEKKSPEPPAELKFEEIILTEEEILRCEEQTENFPDEKMRPTILNALLAQTKGQKFRLLKGWHKCKKCDALCPPEENFCEVCRIKEREAMKKFLFAILNERPWLKTFDAQKILLKRMPHMRTECTPDAIDSARTSLIQSLAGRIRFGDETSPDVKKLVMLEKRVPPEKITPALIKRALSDLKFNLAERPPSLKK